MNIKFCFISLIILHSTTPIQSSHSNISTTTRNNESYTLYDYSVKALLGSAVLAYLWVVYQHHQKLNNIEQLLLLQNEKQQYSNPDNLNPSSIKIIFAPPSPEYLFNAVRDNDIETIKTLIALNTDINATNESNETALMLASWYGYTKIVKLLLEHGADVNRVNNDGTTALMFAAQDYSYTTKESLEIVSLLLDHDADMFIKDHADQTVFDLFFNTFETKNENNKIIKKLCISFEIQKFLKNARNAKNKD